MEVLKEKVVLSKQTQTRKLCLTSNTWSKQREWSNLVKKGFPSLNKNTIQKKS